MSTLPESVRPHLERQLDWDHGVDADLDEIAHHMTRWEVHSCRLGLTCEDVEDINSKHKDKPELQR